MSRFERSSVTHAYATRYNTSLHSLQLIDPVSFDCSALLKRSIYGLVAIWNALPNEGVTMRSVESFQRALQNRAKEVIQSGCFIPDLCDLRWIHYRYGMESHM